MSDIHDPRRVQVASAPATAHANTQTPRTDAAAGEPSRNLEATAERLFNESQKLERELTREREKVRVLREALMRLDLRFMAANETTRAVALAATEDAP